MKKLLLTFALLASGALMAMAPERADITFLRMQVNALSEPQFRQLITNLGIDEARLKAAMDSARATTATVTRGEAPRPIGTTTGLTDTTRPFASPTTATTF